MTQAIENECLSIKLLMLRQMNKFKVKKNWEKNPFFVAFLHFSFNSSRYFQLLPEVTFTISFYRLLSFFHKFHSSSWSPNSYHMTLNLNLQLASDVLAHPSSQNVIYGTNVFLKLFFFKEMIFVSFNHILVLKGISVSIGWGIWKFNYSYMSTLSFACFH